MLSSTLDHALDYARRDWSVFPVHSIVDGCCTCGAPDCQNAGKHPVTSNGFKDATTDEKMISLWWGLNPDHNIGVATGDVSGIVVIDVDEGHGKSGTKSLADLEAKYGPLPETLTARTGGGGRHFFFRRPAGMAIKTSASVLGEHLDVRADRGYVVAAPSRHRSGKSYEWLNVAELAEMPDWLVRLLVEERRKSANRSEGVAGTVFGEGMRNEMFTKVAGMLRRWGMDADDMTTFLEGANASLPSPLPDEEIAGIARSVARYSSGPLPLDDIPLSRLIASEISDHCKWSPQLGWFSYADGKWSIVDQNVVHEYVKRQLEIAAEIVRADKDPEKAQKARSLLTAARLSHMAKLVNSDESVRTPAEAFDAKKATLNLLNGTLDLESLELRPHAATDLLTKRAAVAYDPEATSPCFDKLLNDALPRHHAAFVLRLFGYVLLGDPKEEIFAIFHGRGSNGKSKIAEAVQQVLGDYAGYVDPSAFTKRHDDKSDQDLALVRGAHFVVTSELAKGQLLDAPRVKRMTGGDMIRGKLLYKDVFMYRPRFTVVMTTNALPVVDGGDEALARRLIIVPFNNVIAPEDRDFDLPKKLQAERPGILNRLLQGLADYRRVGLQVPDDIAAVRKAFFAESDMVGRFLAECCETVPGAKAAAGSTYQAYKSWCNQNGIQSMSQPVFKADLTGRGFIQKKTKEGIFWLDLNLPRWNGYTLQSVAA